MLLDAKVIVFAGLILKPARVDRTLPFKRTMKIVLLFEIRSTVEVWSLPRDALCAKILPCNTTITLNRTANTCKTPQTPKERTDRAVGTVR